MQHQPMGCRNEIKATLEQVPAEQAGTQGMILQAMAQEATGPIANMSEGMISALQGCQSSEAGACLLLAQHYVRQGNIESTWQSLKQGLDSDGKSEWATSLWSAIAALQTVLGDSTDALASLACGVAAARTPEQCASVRCVATALATSLASCIQTLLGCDYRHAWPMPCKQASAT
jgi:hypothetical protein